jgi:hypothetical protein
MQSLCLDFLSSFYFNLSTTFQANSLCVYVERTHMQKAWKVNETKQRNVGLLSMLHVYAQKRDRLHYLLSSRATQRPHREAMPPE